MYTDGVNTMYDMLRGPGQLHIHPEQKVVGEYKRIHYDDHTVWLTEPLQHAVSRSAVWPEICVAEAVEVSFGDYTARTRLGSTVSVGTGEVLGGKKKAGSGERRAMLVAGLSGKVGGMMRKMQIGRKTEK